MPIRKESPYFAKTPSKLRKCGTSGSPRSSRYFLRSPSSVHGAVNTLGPLSESWSSSGQRPCIRASCSQDACEVCISSFLESLQPFQGCPQFNAQSVLRRAKIKLQAANQRGATCRVAMDRQAEEEVRHLCRHQCYLRAYLPCRDWWALRQTIQNLTDQPVDTLLQNWTCRLESIEIQHVYSPMEVTSSNLAKLQDSRNCVRVPDQALPSKRETCSRTVFVNRMNGNRLASSSRVIQCLGLDRQGDNEGLKTSFDQGSPSPRCTVRRRLYPTVGDTGKVSVLTGAKSQGMDSPLGLLEELFVNQPWHLLVCTILLNRTRRSQVDRILAQFFEHWPTPEAVQELSKQGRVSDMALLIAPLGIQYRRSKGIVRFTNDYVELVANKEKRQDEAQGSLSTGNVQGVPIIRHETSRMETQNVEFHLSREEIKSLRNCGEYAADAYQIFIQRDWKSLHPSDYALRAFIEWKRSQEAG